MECLRNTVSGRHPDSHQDGIGVTHTDHVCRWTRSGMPLPITADDFGDMESIKSILTPEEIVRFYVMCTRHLYHPVDIHTPACDCV